MSLDLPLFTQKKNKAERVNVTNTNFDAREECILGAIPVKLKRKKYIYYVTDFTVSSLYVPYAMFTLVLSEKRTLALSANIALAHFKKYSRRRNRLDKLLYLSVSKRTVIFQFRGLYFAVRTANRKVHFLAICGKKAV